MGKKGYLKFYRSMLDHPLWLSEPFTKGQAFWDLVARANHTDAGFLCGNTMIHVKRGQLFVSEVKLAERWKWSRNKVRRFLKMLKEQKMATTSGTGIGTLITIENYSIYQGDETDGETTLETAKEQREDKKRNANKKEQEERKKNPKKIYGEYRNVKLSVEDMERLMKEFPTDYQERIERLSEYMASTGKTYKNHLATIRSWARKETGDAGKRTDNAPKNQTEDADGKSDAYEKFFK